MPSNKILIVEDDRIVGMHLKSVLEKANYEVAPVISSGAEAIAYVRENTPGLILMDVMLEGLYDGIETSIEVNKIKNIPVIYLTAINDKSTIHRAKITFPYSFITKPFSETELLANVELTLFKHKYEVSRQQSEELLSSILSKIKSAVLVIDQQYKIKYLNKFLGSLLNIPTDVLTGFILGEDIKLSSLTDETISLQSLIKSDSEELASQKIIYINYGGRQYPINNIYITKASFFKTEEEQYLIMFTDARDRLNKLKASKIKRQQKLNAQLEGVENERARVSRELHDGLGQMLNVIKMKARNLNDNEANLAGILSLIDQTIEETRKISNDLMPSKLRHFDLQSCLNSLCEEFEGTGIQIYYNSNLRPKELDDYKIHIYRIVQEAFNNSLKHSQANKISLQIYKEEEKVRISIEDDGIGFDFIKLKKNLERESHGLTNIMDRVNAMQGEVEFHSDQDFGTSIIIHLKELNNYA